MATLKDLSYLKNNVQIEFAINDIKLDEVKYKIELSYGTEEHSLNLSMNVVDIELLTKKLLKINSTQKMTSLTKITINEPNICIYYMIGQDLITIIWMIDAAEFNSHQIFTNSGPALVMNVSLNDLYIFADVLLQEVEKIKN
jgi:hypothetical protein